MRKILIDTSIFIEMSRTGKGQYLQLLGYADQSGALLLTSVIVISEFWAGDSMRSKIGQFKARKLFADITPILVDEDLAKKAGVIRHKTKIELGDALIAATALAQNAQLATLNGTHFKNIPGLKLWQPPELRPI